MGTVCWVVMGGMCMVFIFVSWFLFKNFSGYECIGLFLVFDICICVGVSGYY